MVREQSHLQKAHSRAGPRKEGAALSNQLFSLLCYSGFVLICKGRMGRSFGRPSRKGAVPRLQEVDGQGHNPA